MRDYEPPPQQRGWWSRNWKWVVPVGCLVPLVVCGGGVALIFSMVFGIIKGSEPYTEAVKRARAHPAVKEALGEPIEEGFMPTGSINTQNVNGVQSGKADLVITISGPKGAATIRVVGNMTDGKWSYSIMEVKLPDQRVIDLRQAG